MHGTANRKAHNFMKMISIFPRVYSESGKLRTTAVLQKDSVM